MQPPPIRLVAAALLAAPALPASAAHAAPSDDSLPARLERLITEVDQRRERDGIAGAAVAVVIDDEVVLARGLGVRDDETGTPVDAETVFGIGSTTKSFTAALALILAREGLLDIDDPVTDALTDFTLSDERASRTLSLRDLLSHRTGWSRMGLLFSGGLDGMEKVLPYAMRATPTVPFRQAFQYANINYVIAGLAEGASADSDWHALIRDRIFTPLGMTRAVTRYRELTGIENHATGYDARTSLDDPRRATNPITVDTIAPAGTIAADVRDMARWLRFWLNRGELDGVRLLDEDDVEEAWQPIIAMAPGKAYGLGFMVSDWHGDRMIDHGGNWNGYATAFAMLPEEEVGVVLLTNSMFSRLQGEFPAMAFDILLGDDEGEDSASADADAASVPASPELMARLEGRYYFDKMDKDMTVAVKDDKLTIDVPGQTVYELLPPDADGKWYFALTSEIAISFEQAGDAPASSLTMYQAGMEFEMPRAAVDADLPSLDDLLAARTASMPADPLSKGGVLIEGTVRFPHQGVDGSFRLLVASRDRQRLTFDLGEIGRLDTFIDGDDSRRIDAFGRATPIESTERALMRMTYLSLLVADLRTVADELEVVDTASVDDRPKAVARLTDGDDTLEATIDVETGLIERESHSQPIPGMGGITMETVFSDFRDVDGTPFPHQHVTSTAGLGDSEITVARVMFGVRVDSAEFATSKAERERVR